MGNCTKICYTTEGTIVKMEQKHKEDCIIETAIKSEDHLAEGK